MKTTPIPSSGHDSMRKVEILAEVSECKKYSSLDRSRMNKISDNLPGYNSNQIVLVLFLTWVEISEID